MLHIFITIPLIFLFISCDTRHDLKTTNNRTIKNESKPEENSDTLYSVIMVGDIMMGTNYPSTGSLPPNNGENLFDDVKEFLQAADVTAGNLEGTLLNKGGTPKICRDSSDNCVSFRMPEIYAGYLADAGFDIISVANNHSGDFGEIGRKSTVKTLEKFKIHFAGYATCRTTIFTKDGIRFGFTAFAPNIGTQNLLDTKTAIKTVKELRKKCDVLIVYFHGGGEGLGSSRVRRKTEYYLGEDRGDVYKFSHSMVDSGADIIFGSGPHVPRGIELYKNRIIAYSLGNFCTYGKFGLSGALGYAPILKVYIEKSGEFIGGRIFPAIQINHGVPVIDTKYKAVEFVKYLSQKDFPESDLIIHDDGKIEKK